MAKIFETESDLNNELYVIKEFCKSKKCEYSKLPKWDLDFLIHKNGKGVAFVEVKCFNNSYSKFDTQMINLRKLNGLLRANEYLPSYFVCKYTDGIYYIHVKDIQSVDIRHGGWNKEREGSSSDKEWLLYFKRNLMKKL